MARERGAGRRFDRTTWIVFVAVLAVGLAGLGLVAARILDDDAPGAAAGDELPPGRLQGRVTVGGEPRADVPVLLTRLLEDGTEENPTEGITLRRSNAGGRFIFNGLEPGTYRVSVRAGLPVFTGDYVPLSVGGVAAFGEPSEVELPSDQGVDGVELDLLPGASLSGRALTRSGRPARALPVRVELLDEHAQPIGLHGQAVTGPDGRWTVRGLPPGRFQVSSSDRYDDPPQPRAVGSGRAPFEPAYATAVASAQDERSRTLIRPVAVPTGGSAQVPTLVLRRTTTLSGTVRRPDGRPRRDVEVVVQVNAVNQWHDGPSAVTDRRGRYRITGLLPGTYLLRAGATYLGGTTSPGSAEPLVVTRRERVRRVDLVEP